MVQFPHPGPEHNPGSDYQPWNTGDHRRKFLCNPGRYVSGDGSLGAGPLVFWGEWEPPSNVLQRWGRKDFLPRFLHEPVWEHPAAGGMPRQNTDPWVFGDCFRYSNCGQLRSGRALQKLTQGSIVLFGSAIRLNFVIDTVFVVKDSCRFSPNKPPDTDEAFRVCVVESLLTTGSAAKGCPPGKSIFAVGGAACAGAQADDPLTLYKGATYEAPFKGMYSFVPCRRADVDNARFPRPAISLPGYVNPKSKQAAKGASSPRSAAEVREQWEKVRKQVLDADCLLGVSFSTPRLIDARADAKSPTANHTLGDVCSGCR